MQKANPRMKKKAKKELVKMPTVSFIHSDKFKVGASNCNSWHLLLHCLVIIYSGLVTNDPSMQVPLE